MKRVYLMTFAALVLTLTFIAGGYAATKSYQFSGTVKSVDGTIFTVEKSAKETWTIETSKDTKGAPKVGDKVTVYYKMIATEIEGKPTVVPVQKKKQP